MSKDKILGNIQKNKPAATPLPEIPAFPIPSEPLLDVFSQQATANGCRVVFFETEAELKELIPVLFPDAQTWVSPLYIVAKAQKPSDFEQPIDLKAVDVALLRGELGVAENAAIWLRESTFYHRALPFIVQHLAIILSESDLVFNMHQAYQKIGNYRDGFGVFIAGPSKTADIEQSLVIGAQGARSLTILLQHQK